MAWQPWSSGNPGVVPGLSGLPSVVNAAAAAAVLPSGSQYSPEQWAQMQQQNWQQWAQWQQQYQQWHQQYGAEYQKSISALSQTSQAPQGLNYQAAVPNTSVPPPLPKDSKPPPPPDEPPKDNAPQVPTKNITAQPNFMSDPPPNFNTAPPQQHHPQTQPIFNSAAPPPRNQPPPNMRPNHSGNFNYNNQNRPMNQYNDMTRNPPPRKDFQGDKRYASQPPFSKKPLLDEPPFSKKPKLDEPVFAKKPKLDEPPQRSPSANSNEDMSETEKRFVKQFTEWEAQFNKWKDQNMNHPDKEQYKEYEKKWETWRTQLLERREQMRRKRLGLADKPGPKSTQVLQPLLGSSFPTFNKDLDTSKPPPLLRDPIPAKDFTVTKDTLPLKDLPPSNEFAAMKDAPLSRDLPASTDIPPTKDTFPESNASVPAESVPDESNIEIPEETETDDFLKMSKDNDGIPGLDLVEEDDDDDEEKKENVVDLDSEDPNATQKTDKDSHDDADRESNKGPDLEALSKGINNILGDQKLLNMLSMVSQNQTGQIISGSIDSTSKIPANTDSQTNYANPNENLAQPADRWSNPDQQEYANRGKDNVSNFDEQSRSSFGARGAELDWRDRQGGGNRSDFNSGANDFEGNYQGDNFGGRGNYDKQNMFGGPGNFKPNENFRGSGNFKDGPDNFTGGPNNFRGGPDNFRGGRDNFRGGRDNFRGGRDNFRGGPDKFRGGPDNFRGGPDNFGGGPDNFGGGPDGFRGAPDNYRGMADSSKGGPDNFRGGPGNFRGGLDGGFRSGADNFRGGPDNARGAPNNARGGPDNFRGGHNNLRGAPDGRGGPDNFRGGQTNFRGGLNNFRGGLNNFRGGPDNFRGGSNNLRGGRGGNFRSGPDNHESAADSFSGGPDNFRGGSESFKAGSDNFKAGSDNFKPGSDNFKAGSDNFKPGSDNFKAGSDNFKPGSDNFKAGSDNFKAGSDNFKAGSDNLKDVPGNFRGGADNFRRGQNNFRDGQNRPGQEEFGDEDGSKNFRGSNRLRGPDKFGGPPDDTKGPAGFGGGNEGRKLKFEPPLPDSFGGRFEPPPRSQQNINRNDGFNRFENDQRKPAEFGRGPSNFPDRNLGSSRDFGKFGSNDMPRQNFGRNDRRNFGRKGFDEEADAPTGGFKQGLDSFRSGPGSQNMNSDTFSRAGNFGRDRKDFNRQPSFQSDRGNFGEEEEEPMDDFENPDDNMRDWSNQGDDLNTNQNRAEDTSRPMRGPDFPSGSKNDVVADVEMGEKGHGDQSPDEKEEPLWQPTQIIEYDHKSSNLDEFDVSLEPLRTFDYRHKNVNRIPFPQRPPWLTRILKKYPEFDFVLQRSYEQPFNRYPERYERFADTGRYESRWNNREPSGSRRGPDESNRPSKRFDDFGPSNRRSHDGPAFTKRDHSRSNDDVEMMDVSRERRFENYRNRSPNNTPVIDLDDPKFDKVENEKFPQVQPKPRSIPNITLIQDLLNPPGRYNRAPRIVIILRGPPGSGKTFLAKLIKDKEVENGGSTPRILSLDDYFMVEQEKEVEEDGKKTKVKEMVYEYEEGVENTYRISLFKAFKKTITDGYFPFIIVDNVNDKVKYFGDMWSFAKQNGFQVYICQMEFDLNTCTKRNIHNRSEAEIQKLISSWEATPSHHPILDATSLIQAGSIPEVEMEEINSPPSEDLEDEDPEDRVCRSKWDNFDCSIDNLAKLDGTNKPLRTSKTMEDYLQCDDDWVCREAKPGQKRVRWADLEERKKQEKMRAIGFVVGQTNWDRMMDPTMGSSALTQTKYIERVKGPRFYNN